MKIIKITIEDVAREAEVSITTVSRVINNNYPVSEATRAKVTEVIKRLNFTPNALARGLIQKKTNTIGVITPSITNIYFAVVIGGIQEYLRKKGYHILLCDTSGVAKNELEQVRKLQESRVDGIIAIDPRTANIKNGFYKQISREIPTVIINGFNQGVKLNFILNDQEGGTWEALDYLYFLGHRNIVFLKGQKSYSYDIKEIVYRNFISKHSIPFKEENILTIEKGNSIETMDLATNIVMKRFSIYQEPDEGHHDMPTAIFCCNDFMAVGALHGVLKLGLQVPEHVSIIGYDNTIVSQMTVPKLTTVDQNMERLGNTAAEQLMKVIQNPDYGCSKTILDTRLLVRESCKTVE